MAGVLQWIFHFILMAWLLQNTNCAKLSYANCSEVVAEDPSVIEGISHKFFCEISHKGYQSCTKLLVAGFYVSGYYEIDPDGLGQGVTGFLVFCDMGSAAPLCQNKLGLENNTIPDTSITASTQAEPFRANEGRLNGKKCWIASYLDLPSSSWIQVDFGKSMRISGIITQGSGGGVSNYYVKTLEVQYKMDEHGSFQTIGTFDANTDTTTPKTILFEETIDAVIVRVEPLSFNRRVGMRWEILGCEPGTTVIDHEQTQSSDLLEVKKKPGEVVIPIKYKPSLEQISALLAASDTCQQHIQYDCQNSKIWDENGRPYVWWKSRQGKDMFNFGGVPTGSERCACSQQTIDNCSNKLGVENGSIADSEITASSELDKNHDAAQGRLNYIHPIDKGSDAWVAKLDDSDPWIQASFTNLTWVSGVMLQGRSDHSKQWVETYKVLYTSNTTDIQNWTKITDETNLELVFTGNTDKTTIVTSMFPSRVLAKAVRIYPVTWQNEYVGLRFELLGCRPDNCINKLGVEDGRIADSAIKASTELDHNHDATQGRLNYIHPIETGSDAWVAEIDDSNPWIQATFSELTWVSGVMLQGRSDYTNQQWVETYKVQYTTDNQKWMKMEDEAKQERVFIGNTDKTTIVTSMFPSHVLAKAVRIYPVDFQSEYVGLRFELLGCLPVCTTRGKKCNCDGLRSIWEKDAGFLSDKEQLPITALRYGGNDESKCTIGPLECNGTRSLPKRSCAELWEEGVRLDMEYEIDPDGPDGLGPPFNVFCNLRQAAPILRSCEELRLAGYTSDGYYDIDPDGPENGELAFTVFCIISDTDARTRINHDSESKGRVQGYKDPGDFVLSPKYMAWSPEQMRNLIGVSERCFQDIKYNCYNSRLFKSNKATDAEAWWISGDNGKMVNWGGVPPGKFGCSCSQSDPNTCTDACNCDDDDDDKWKEDGGLLTDKDTLPVMKVYLANTETSTKSGYHTLGPLICLGKNDTYPLYRTCAELSCAGYNRNGNYLLDSDGTNTGDDPFVAYCDMENNGVTILSHKHPNTINMKNVSADREVPIKYAASINQLKALASLSGSCRQHLNLSCNQFPIWDGLKVSWNSVNGQKMNNWGGVPTKDYGCACKVKVPAECSSSGKECNCDENDDSMRVDEGWLMDKHVLPVTSLNAKATGNTTSVGMVTLGSFECQGSDLPSPLRTCDEYMNAGFGSGWYQIDPDGPEGSLASFIVNCDKGATVIHHDSEERRLATGNGNTTDGDQTVQRAVNYKATMKQILAVMNASQYCRQFIKYECHGSTIVDSTWISRDGGHMHNWGTVATGETCCKCGLDDSCDIAEKKCNCLSNDAVWRSDEGYLQDESKLPVSKLVIGDVDEVRELVYYTLGPLECFKKSSDIKVLESCHHLKQAGHTMDRYYDIDPDGSGAVEPFAVYCDMSDGSTVIGHNREEKTLVRDTDKEDIEVDYLATVDQILALISISSHCHQKLSYDCHRSALFGSDFKHIAYWKHGKADENHYNFGGVDMGLMGCSCGLNRSCGDGKICNCDEELLNWESDSGLITNRDQLPIVFMGFGDTNGNKRKGFYTLGKLKCSNKKFTSCEELRESGYMTDGYYTIHSDDSPPELQFCKMTQQGVDICPVYRTGPDYLLQYRFPELPDHVTSFTFSVEAKSDVFIALSTQPAKPKGDNEGMYEIAIKPEGPDQVKIQRCDASCAMMAHSNVEVETGLTQSFCIKFADNLVEVGHVGKPPMLSYTDSSPIAIRYVGFSSGFGNEAEWRFHKYLCNGFRGAFFLRIADNIKLQLIKKSLSTAMVIITEQVSKHVFLCQATCNGDGMIYNNILHMNGLRLKALCRLMNLISARKYREGRCRQLYNHQQ